MKFDGKTCKEQVRYEVQATDTFFDCLECFKNEASLPMIYQLSCQYLSVFVAIEREIFVGGIGLQRGQTDDQRDVKRADQKDVVKKQRVEEARAEKRRSLKENTSKKRRMDKADKN